MLSSISKTLLSINAKFCKKHYQLDAFLTQTQGSTKRFSYSLWRHPFISAAKPHPAFQSRKSAPWVVCEFWAAQIQSMSYEISSQSQGNQTKMDSLYKVQSCCTKRSAVLLFVLMFFILPNTSSLLIFHFAHHCCAWICVAAHFSIKTNLKNY